MLNFLVPWTAMRNRKHTWYRLRGKTVGNYQGGIHLLPSLLMVPLEIWRPRLPSISLGVKLTRNMDRKTGWTVREIWTEGLDGQCEKYVFPQNLIAGGITMMTPSNLIKIGNLVKWSFLKYFGPGWSFSMPIFGSYTCTTMYYYVNLSSISISLYVK